MSKLRIETEHIAALDEHGSRVTITRTRTIRREPLIDGSYSEIEEIPSLSIPGVGHVTPIDDPVYHYRIVKTGMKLRDAPQ